MDNSERPASLEGEKVVVPDSKSELPVQASAERSNTDDNALEETGTFRNIWDSAHYLYGDRISVEIVKEMNNRRIGGQMLVEPNDIVNLYESSGLAVKKNKDAPGHPVYEVKKEFRGKEWPGIEALHKGEMPSQPIDKSPYRASEKIGVRDIAIQGLQLLHANEFLAGTSQEKEAILAKVQRLITRAQSGYPFVYRDISEFKGLQKLFNEQSDSLRAAYRAARQEAEKLKRARASGGEQRAAKKQKRGVLRSFMGLLGIKPKLSAAELEESAKEAAELRMEQVRAAVKERSKQEQPPLARESLPVAGPTEEAAKQGAASEVKEDASAPAGDTPVASPAPVVTDVSEAVPGTSEVAPPVELAVDATPEQSPASDSLLGPAAEVQTSQSTANGFEPVSDLEQKNENEIVGSGEPVSQNGTLNVMPNVEESMLTPSSESRPESEASKLEARPGLSAIRHALQEASYNLEAFNALSLESFDNAGMARAGEMLVLAARSLDESIDALVADIDSVSDSSQLAVSRDSLVPLKEALSGVVANIKTLSLMRAARQLEGKGAQVGGLLRTSAGSIKDAAETLIKEIDTLAASSQSALLDPQQQAANDASDTLFEAINRKLPPKEPAESIPQNVDLSAIHNMETDPLFRDAVEVVLERGRASAVVLQRQLGIGYARGIRILDQMTLAGITGPDVPSGARDIKISQEQWRQFDAA